MRSARDARWRGRFDQGVDDDSFGTFGNLVDVMLVFACGLIAALATSGLGPQSAASPGQGRTVEQGTELPEVPEGIGQGPGGFESVGTVYRDPKTGKLILIGRDTE